MSWILRTTVDPSLKEKSEKSSSPFLPVPALMLKTPFSPTFTFLPPSAVTLAKSGRLSDLVFFSIDF
jgi:hypothetical protein